ncbi:BREX-1 system adenine-specific DNA-methyltransferase PglX [Flagellimonas alvinocaridis]|uniref:site-specific DNA-methyltransferase (adenine-specific) n=1 Tax=Flagellimonas alvinocaridis TaxID=2530200 RepID=A0A4S8RSQ1_9FLAO|nr:BREX-1 system adenine-specific DNA-methyltransferase PglX [Allomuricauda alvinocaridis]THV60831.1 BREX-1 system adenine-specific DNA-methyltransferase PglX [Allomuricauda alvinocaridis]
MNTNRLKHFAQEARVKLLDQIGAKLEKVLTSDSAELREKAGHLQKLQEAINKTSKEQVIDTVAYTWFNRFAALRFMDVNGYEPLGIPVVSPIEGGTLPALLQEAKQGAIPEELPVMHQSVYDVLDGKIPSADAQNEAYRALLVGACNHLNKMLPFLFERINDYAELLLPDDLTSQFSILQDVRDGMPKEDCKEVEILGWLYQYYISEKKDELINAKKRYKAEEIAPVTQLFTPKWIVQYMVDNTLGQLWKEAKPTTNLTKDLEFYIEPNNQELIPDRNIATIEDITFFDPCVGSAHVLCYAFDLFYKIYEEEGYNPTEIPGLIISKNLYGIDIDDRAAQIAGFALMMKGRKANRRFFKKQVVPNITAFQNIGAHPKFENAKVLGSLIKIDEKEFNAITVDKSSLFAYEELQLKKQAHLLSTTYDIVVTNPPYLNSSYMEGTLKQYVEKEYKETKTDLFACFLVQASNFAKEDGLIGFICPYVWMFIKSYEWLRQYVIQSKTISTLVQLEYNAFGPAVVPIGTFVLRNATYEGYSGSYIRLSDFKGVENQKPKTLEALKNRNCGWFYLASQEDFTAIPGFPIAYFASNSTIEIFNGCESMDSVIKARQGISTADNERFLRAWHEVNFNKSSLVSEDACWVPHNKGGTFRKWYGNHEYFINWANDGFDIKNFFDAKGKRRSVIRNPKYYFEPSVSWSDVTSSTNAFRVFPEGFIHNGCAPSAFGENEEFRNCLAAFGNLKYTADLVQLINPTMHFSEGYFSKLPFTEKFWNREVSSLSELCIQISKQQWHSSEISWNFQQNELLRINGQDMEEAYDSYCQYWQKKFFELHTNEEELNRQFIEIYTLQDELTPVVPLEDITILKDETTIENGQLHFRSNEIMAQFISYAVGCMFGRYSLDKPGLVLANQGETLEDYLKAVSIDKVDISFMPDDDNIIPVLDNEWFEDDIVGRFYEFLKVTFGKKDFEKNIAFVEDAVGDIRKYFLKSFYPDHIKRYKKRPIYWMFSSPSGAFNVLVYMHRYTPDTLNTILNGYVKEYREKLSAHNEQLNHVKSVGTAREQNQAAKEQERINKVLLELQEYERDLYKLATERIAIDLDDGVLVNYNKFGSVIKTVSGLNDKKAKAKVKKFDWIDVTQIQ